LVVFVDIDSAEQVRPLIEQVKMGGVLVQWGNYSLAQTKKLIQKLQGWAQKSPHKIPLLISIDYEGGTVHTPITLGFDYLPTNMMLSAAGSEERTASVAYLAGQELRRAGVHMNFSPVLDVNSNPHNPIIGVRSFGSDPELVSRMGVAMMNGFRAAGVLSIVKHYPGHGDTQTDSHFEVPVVKADEKTLREVHLKPFARAIAAGADGVMTGHILYPAWDDKNISTFSKKILYDILHDELGFKGLVVTDSLDMRSATAYCTIAGCAVKSFEAGADMILLGRYIKPQATFNKIFAQVQAQNMQERVNLSARKIYEVKKQIGLLDGTLTTPAPIEKAFRQQLQQVSRQAVTLVRDRKHFLPVHAENKTPSVCAVFFAPARFADQLSDFAKPFLEKGWKVRTYNASFVPHARDISRAQACAKGADVVVVTSLQWADKANLSQKKAFNALVQEHPDVVLISTMSPYDIANYPEADTILATYGLNRYALRTAADILLGNIEAQGKLPVDISALKQAQ
jgi:beta-N-acetylhexosaminidase